MEKKTVAILGMGIFGETLAKALNNYNMDVIAIDINMERIEAVKDYVASALCLDFTNLEELRAAGVGDSDIAIVCTSEKLEESVLGTVNLNELGIPMIICESNNDTYSDILKKVGADRIVSPEKELAENLAKKMVSSTALELLDVDKENTIYDVTMPQSWAGKCLSELKLRDRFHINVIGIRHEGKLNTILDPNEKLDWKDEILFIGKSDLFKNDKIFD